jgi:phage FluMu protein Com
MNLRCIYCQTPFALARAEMLGAIITMNEKHQNHYDAHCPRCRRANSISRQRMELFFPNWQEAAKQQASTPSPTPKADTPATAFLKTEPLPKAKVVKTSEKKLVEKKTTTKKPAAAKEKKPAVKKPAAKASEPKTKKK